MVEEDVNLGEHDFPRPTICPKCKKHTAGLSPHITDKGLQWKVVCNTCGLESEIKNDPLDAVEAWGKMER